MMLPPYSVDLQWRILWLFRIQHASTAEVSRLLNVSTRIISRYVRVFGDVEPNECRHGPQHPFVSSSFFLGL